MHLLSRFDLRVSTALIWLATQGVSQTVPAPNLDLNSLGDVTLAGNFDAISVYSSVGQQQGYSSNGTQSILSQLPTGAYDHLWSTDASIQAMCPLVLQDGTISGLVVGGNFTSIGGVAARSCAMLNVTTRKIEALSGLEGTVSALYCDKETETVYVGGAFEAGNNTNAIAYKSGSWSSLPFAGFDAPVTSITKAPNGHIVFGGSFTGLGNVSSSSLLNSQVQVINLASASISAEGNTTTAGLGDPRNVVCPSNSTDGNSTFLFADNTAGSWRAELAYGFEPTKLRLWNANSDGRGIRTWRFTALPINGIMNFTYTDPETGNTAHCDARCPLAQNASQPYQDFYFVNRVGMNSFTIDVSEWYGAGAGFDGIELFQSDIFAYAIEAFNEPSCETSALRSEATATGPWYTTPSRQSVADYLTAVVGPTTVNSTSIVFEPDVPKGGNYSIIVYTPGCIQDSSCSARAIVNVTGTLTEDGNQAFNTQLFQTNNFDKYDQVYQGHVDATSDTFRPSVTIIPSGLQTDQLIVASRVRFGLISSTGGLNGLFDYDPKSDFVDMDFTQSAINNAGTELHANAHVLALTTQNDTIYAAGRFSDDLFENIMAFQNGNATSLPGGGLNAPVTSLYTMDDFLYVGGNFTGTNKGGLNGLNNVAAYQYSKNAWVPLGAGLDGPVEAVVPLMMNISQNTETVIAFSGSFTQILQSGSDSAERANGLAIWVPSKNAWIQTLKIQKEALAGQLFAATFLPNNTWLGAGTLGSLGLAMSGAAGMRSQSGQVTLQQLPIDIDTTSSSGSTSSRKRAVATTGTVAGVNSGAYYSGHDQNVTIFGGHFTATGTNGSTINNLMFLNGSNNNLVTGAPEGLDSNSTIMTMVLSGDLLFAGGRITGHVGNANINGLALYDMTTAAFRTIQPASLQGPDVVVNALVPKSGTSAVYVGGAFDQTSQGLPCPCVCMYDTATSQWNTVGTELDGTVSALFWTSKTTLLAAGNLTVANNQTSLASYDTKSQMWTATSNPVIPGPVSAFAPATDNADHMWVAGTANNGSTFLVEIDGDNNRPVVDAFGTGTTIQGLQVMPLTKDHKSTDFMDNDQALLVTGQLNISGFGNAAAALFNGTTMAPLILASTLNGDPGSISQVFTSKTNNLKSSHRGHSRGIAVLVALCAALGTIFLIILLGIILNRIQRRRAGYKTVPSVPYADKNSNIHRVPPEALLGHLGSKQPAAPTV
ncbi:Squalestatin S1 biosynthesis cluster protein L1 [Exophiala dermatitidis]|uniref:Cellular morphogenesis protein n=1 Tax=Exophiala dermatitidis (strain ATCC 34100 / CBS 525.76 / NIH/UT8656) TaxID=858893 RepID=H6C242_EXODN|nr:uncharacterized protein HMPREF1120_05891 [Exophiala dermatitidis NIH/UT8656]EHY57868.1 hypothetical protein HMPREF1120_05891 [Exophiala dermatitidis NIH/UT8656]